MSVDTGGVPDCIVSSRSCFGGYYLIGQNLGGGIRKGLMLRVFLFFR